MVVCLACPPIPGVAATVVEDVDGTIGFGTFRVACVGRDCVSTGCVV